MKNLNWTKILLSFVLLTFITLGLGSAISLAEGHYNTGLGIFASTSAVIVMILLRDVLMEDKLKRS